MKNKLESENKMNDQIIQKKKREYKKRQSITDRSFVFTKELLTRLEYQGNGSLQISALIRNQRACVSLFIQVERKHFMRSQRKKCLIRKKGKQRRIIIIRRCLILAIPFFAYSLFSTFIFSVIIESVYKT